MQLVQFQTLMPRNLFITLMKNVKVTSVLLCDEHGFHNTHTCVLTCRAPKYWWVRGHANYR